MLDLVSSLCYTRVFSSHECHNLAGLTAFALLVSILGIFYSFFLLMVPVIYEKYDKGARLARALKEVRVGFILTATGVTVSLLIA